MLSELISFDLISEMPVVGEGGIILLSAPYEISNQFLMKAFRGVREAHN